MNLETKLQISIGKRAGNVILRREIAGLGGASQLSEALKRLMVDGKLVRLGAGVFAKAHRESDGSIQTDASLQALAHEVFEKLGTSVVVRQVGREGNAPVLIMDAGTRHVKRKLDLKVAAIKESKSKRDTSISFDLPQDVSLLPKSGVRQFIQSLARAHDVVHKRSGLDAFAEAITRVSGDDTRLDETGKLLVELKKRHIINGGQLARLATNYMAEVLDVRSIQGLRGPGLPTQR